MSVQLLLQQKSRLKDESNDVQQAMRCFASGLCREFNIDPNGLQHVTHFGYATDNNNCEAISHWVYIKATQADTTDQKDFKDQLTTQLERELTVQ